MKTIAWFAVVLILVAGVALGVPRAASAPADPPRLRDPLRSFIPTAGYLKTALALFSLRRSQENTVGYSTSDRGRHTRITGERHLPVICLEYSNVPLAFPVGDYQHHLFGRFGGAPDPRLTMTQYYLDVSHGKLKVGGKIVGPYRLPEKDSYYEDGQQGVRGGSPNHKFGELLRIGLEKADAQVDFGRFDNDGRDGIPNSGDDDGVVDTVVFIQPEAGAECEGEAASNIWSHSGHYDEPWFGHKGPYVTRAIRKQNLQGDPVLESDGDGKTPVHIVINDYTIQPGLACPTSPGQQPRITPIGVYCHEFGHTLGLPDLYDRRPDSVSHGVGQWCLMGSGNYGGDGGHSETPTHMSAWCKYFLGWGVVETLSGNGLFDVEPVEDRGALYKIVVPRSGNKEYFLIEYRDPLWRDTAYQVKYNWDHQLPSAGLAIWHVDETVGDNRKTWPMEALGKGQNDAASLPGTPIPPSSFVRPHALVALVQADGKLDLEHGTNRGDAGDLWTTGRVFRDDPSCRGGSRGYDGRASWIALIPKILSGDASSIEVRLDDPPDGEQPSASPPLPPKGNLATAAQQLRVAQNAVSEADITAQRNLHALDDAIERYGEKALTASASAWLVDVTNFQIETSVQPSHAPLIAEWAARARTRAISPSTAPSGPIEQTIKDRLEGQNAVARFSPSRKWVERLTGLPLRVADKTLRDGAWAMVKGPLKPLIGGDLVHLTPTVIDKEESGRSPQRFHQTIDHEGSSMPVFDTDVALYFDRSQRLTTMTCKIVMPGVLKIVGEPGRIRPGEARALIRTQLGLADEIIRECREGVYLINDDPAKARVAFRATIGAGQNDGFVVFFDTTSRTVLDVR